MTLAQQHALPQPEAVEVYAWSPERGTYVMDYTVRAQLFDLMLAPLRLRDDGAYASCVTFTPRQETP